jgi:hypothetical protein
MAKAIAYYTTREAARRLGHTLFASFAVQAFAFSAAGITMGRHF